MTAGSTLARASLFLFLAATAFAQTRIPGFLWEGDVDQSAVLLLQGGRLEASSPRGEPVQNQRYRVLQPPVDSRQNVRLDILEGRGSARVTQQPTLENDYSVAVTIEDRQDGRSHYSIALYWDSPVEQIVPGRKPWKDVGWQGDGARPELGKPVKLTWSGRVEGETVVECHLSECRATMPHGLPLTDARARFERPVPRADMLVRVSGSDAGGNIRILEQPLAANNYTVRVGIAEGCGGRRACRFTLEWREPDVTERKVEARRALFWSGEVTGAVRVTVRDSSTLSSGHVTGEQPLFDRPLPHRAGLPLAIRKLHGRGTVEIVETPSDQNGFSLIFEIQDPGPGSSDYQVELSW